MTSSAVIQDVIPHAPIRLWICNGSEPWCGANEPCDVEGLNCGWREYATLDQALLECILSCSECNRNLADDDDDYPGGSLRKPRLHRGSLYCSIKCLKRGLKERSRRARALRDLVTCAKAAGIAPQTYEVWGLTYQHGRTDPRTPSVLHGHELPALRVQFAWGSATLYLGSKKHKITTCLRDWSACTGKPIPPSRTLVATPFGKKSHDWNPADLPGAMSQEQWELMLRDWLTKEIYGKDLDNWDAAQERRGLYKKWEPGQMDKPDWRWDGEKRCVLYVDGKPVVDIRKTLLGAGKEVSWWLHLPDGRALLAGRDKDQQIWRIGKREAQAAAVCWARGEDVAP